MSMNFETKEEFLAARKEFFESHPEAKEAKTVGVLNLIMKREYAEQIVKGTKKLEFRSYSPHYVKRLIDPDVADYISRHLKDEEVLTFCNDIRQVARIHFHNYNNSWFLDVKCTFNDVFQVNDNDVKMLQDTYGCHDFDEDLRILNASNEERRPWVFYFVCGEVLDTNL